MHALLQIPGWQKFIMGFSIDGFFDVQIALVGSKKQKLNLPTNKALFVFANHLAICEGDNPQPDHEILHGTAI